MRIFGFASVPRLKRGAPFLIERVGPGKNPNLPVVRDDSEMGLPLVVPAVNQLVIYPAPGLKFSERDFSLVRELFGPAGVFRQFFQACEGGTLIKPGLPSESRRWRPDQPDGRSRTLAFPHEQRVRVGVFLAVEYFVPHSNKVSRAC